MIEPPISRLRLVRSMAVHAVRIRGELLTSACLKSFGRRQAREGRECPNPRLRATTYGITVMVWAALC